MRSGCGKKMHLGTFDSKDEAEQASQGAVRKYRGATTAAEA
jgi:hypothetical protein